MLNSLVLIIINIIINTVFGFDRYRARILERVGPCEFKVVFVDYGNEEIISTENVNR